MEINKINSESDGIKVKGHRGTWYAIDTDTSMTPGMTYYLLEHETYGDEAAHVIVSADGELVLDDVWNGFDDLREYLTND